MSPNFSTPTQTSALRCPGCGSPHLVEESKGRYLCLDCHSLSEADGGGQKLVVAQRLCARCGSENPGEAATCRECGLALTPQCMKCGARMAVWHDVCPRCGTDQAAYRAQVAAQERERQRQSQQRRRYRRRRGHPWRGLWRMGWLVWPLMWLVSSVGRSLPGNLERLLAQGLGASLPAQVSSQTLSLAVGACIFGVGVVLSLMSLLPLISRHD